MDNNNSQYFTWARKLVSVIGLVSQIVMCLPSGLTFLQRPSSIALQPKWLLASEEAVA